MFTPLLEEVALVPATQGSGDAGGSSGQAGAEQLQVDRTAVAAREEEAAARRELQV